MSSPPRRDWSLRRDEQIAEQLPPAARVAVDRAAPAEGEHVVDVGCGTGNASLLAAARGARVTGIDPAERLLEPGGGWPANGGWTRRSSPGRQQRFRSGTGRPTWSCRPSA